MEFKRIKAIDQMNAWGRESKPFLFIIDFEMLKIKLISCDQLEKYPVQFDIGCKDCTSNEVYSKTPAIERIPVSKNIFRKGFEKVLEHIHHGNTYLLNLTYPSEIRTKLNLDQLYQLSKAEYKLKWADEFIVFSPETFVKISNGKIFSFPMKGTIDADLANAKEKLINDSKELAEHYTIVDLIRNDLNRVASNVHVSRFRYFDLIMSDHKNLYQTSSEIVGDLDKNWKESLGNIIFGLLPAGSISGAPKMKTLEIIKEAELGPRGYYTGIFGLFDGSNLDSGVMIRYIENVQGKLQFRSGGGITSKSRIETEYQELINKIYVPTV